MAIFFFGREAKKITLFLASFCLCPHLKRGRERERLGVRWLAFTCFLITCCLLPQAELFNLSPSRYNKVTTDMLKKKKPTRPAVLKRPRMGYTQIPTDMYTHIILQNVFRKKRKRRNSKYHSIDQIIFISLISKTSMSCANVPLHRVVTHR